MVSRKLNIFMGVMLVMALIAKIATLLTTYYDWFTGYDEWTFTEFLINYEGGFVRRGLLGQGLLELARLGVNPWIPITILSLGAYIALFAILLRQSIRYDRKAGPSQIPLWWLVLSPLLLGDVWYMFGRDLTCMLLMIALIATLKPASISAPRVAGAALIVVFTLLIHEAFIFWGIPLVVIWLWGRKLTAQGWTIATVGSATFLLLAAFKGDPATAQAIHDSWMPYLPAEFGTEPSAALGAIGWKTAYAMVLHIKVNFLGFNNSMYGFFLWPITYIIVAYLVVNMIGGKLKGVAAALMIYSTVGLLPMFTVLCCDYSRLFQFLVFSVFIMWVMVPHDQLIAMVPARFLKTTDRIVAATNRVIKPSIWVMAALILCVGVAHGGFWPEQNLLNSPLGSIADCAIRCVKNILTFANL